LGAAAAAAEADERGALRSRSMRLAIGIRISMVEQELAPGQRGPEEVFQGLTAGGFRSAVSSGRRRGERRENRTPLCVGGKAAQGGEIEAARHLVVRHAV